MRAHPATDLVVLLDARRRHAVDNRIAAGIHVANHIADGEQRERKHNAEPQDNVEDDRIIVVVVLRQVQILCLRNLFEKFECVNLTPIHHSPVHCNARSSYQRIDGRRLSLAALHHRIVLHRSDGQQRLTVEFRLQRSAQRLDGTREQLLRLDASRLRRTGQTCERHAGAHESRALGGRLNALGQRFQVLQLSDKRPFGRIRCGLQSDVFLLLARLVLGHRRQLQVLGLGQTLVQPVDGRLGSVARERIGDLAGAGEGHLIGAGDEDDNGYDGRAERIDDAEGGPVDRFLHGIAERGGDNLAQRAGRQRHGGGLEVERFRRVDDGQATGAIGWNE